MQAPAVSAGGRIFYHTVVSWIGQQKLGAASLRLGDAADPASAGYFHPVPFTAPDGKVHSSIRSPAWIGEDTLVFLAEELFYEGSTFLPDTFFTGRDIILVDLSGSTPVFQPLPGADDASSVWVEAPGTVYYTLGGDTRIFRRHLVSGVVDTLYDFGPEGIVRDVTVHGTLAAAVVGRSVAWQYEAAHDGFVQRDEGGDLWLVDLAGGTAQVLYSADSILFRHPVFSPDGQRLVVEVQPYAPPHLFPDSDFNATNHRADLWLFTVLHP